MGFRGTPIQRPADAVKIFLLFCIPPAAPSDNCAPLAFLAFGSSLFFGAMPVARRGQCGIVRPFARGAMRALGSGCCGLRRNAPARAPYFACGSIRAWGSGYCRRRLPCRRRQYACAARLCAQSAYAAQWTSPAGRRAAPPAPYPRFFLFYGFRFVLKAAGGAKRRFFVPRRPQFLARLMHSVWPSCRNARLHLRRILFCVDFLFLNFVRH